MDKIPQIQFNPFTAECAIVCGPAGLSDYDAMVWILTLAWDARRRVHGDACPWNFAQE